MYISPVMSNQIVNNHSKLLKTSSENQTIKHTILNNQKYSKVPAGFQYGANIHFGEFFYPNRTYIYKEKI